MVVVSAEFLPMDNITIARLLDETAALLEIDGADTFRIRSYRRAAEAVEQQTTQLAGLVADPKQLLAIAGIGKGMSINIVDILASLFGVCQELTACEMLISAKDISWHGFAQR